MQEKLTALSMREPRAQAELEIVEGAGLRVGVGHRALDIGADHRGRHAENSCDLFRREALRLDKLGVFVVHADRLELQALLKQQWPMAAAAVHVLVFEVRPE